MAARRTALGLALAILATGWLCGGAVEARADAAQVTVVTPGGAQQTLSLEALAGSEDVRERTYTLRSAQGEATRTVSGFSLAALLEAADADPFGFSYLEMQRAASGAILLSRHQALDASAFPEGAPVVYATAAGTGFLRPSSGSEDLNATDSFEAPQGISLVLRKGEPLRVRAKASPQRTRPGQPVSFSAVVEQAGAGEQLSYSWYFDDGHSATGASARHTFAKRGSYDVVVGVTTPGDEAGASAVVTVQVGAPLGGPDRKGGGRNRAAGAPDHGAASGGGAPGATGSPASPPAVAPCCRIPTKRRHAAEKRRPNRQTPRPRPQPAGEPVSGRLLSASDRRPLAPAPAARAGQLSESRSGAGLSGTAIGLLVTAGLLGLGAFVELRGLLP